MEKDLTNRDLGKKRHKCRICGEEGLFQSYLVREMMKETMDEFEYFLCPNCQCLQISDIPDNLGDYYGNDYYSMKDDIDPDKPFEKPLIEGMKILDMGCGIGSWLYEMASEGYGNLYGCDPYIEKDIDYGDRVHIKKCEISEIDGDGTYDVVRMCDSFEHVVDPRLVLENARRLIKDDGSIGISLPVYPNIAFDMFQAHWYQLDAPRHIFIHSMKSLKYLADECDLSIKSIKYNSDPGQVVISYFYQHSVFYHRISQEMIRQYFPDAEMKKISDLTAEANEKQIGDHALIWFTKNKG